MSEQENKPEMADSAQAEAAVEAAEEASEASDTAEEQEEKTPYELLGIEDQEGSIKRVSFRVAWEEYEKKSLSTFEELQQNADIEGFRKGKAPLRLVRTRFGRQVKSDTVETLAANCLQQIIEANDFTVYNRFDDDLPEIEEGKALEFASSLEVKPEIKVEGYDSFDVEVDDLSVTDAMVDEQIEAIREANAILEDKGAKAIEEGDAVVLTTQVADENGAPIQTLSWKEREVEKLEYLPEEIRAALIGKKKGASLEASTEHTHGDHTHKQNWKIDIIEVKRRTLPKLDDEFARDAGAFESLDHLRKKIRDDLDKQRQDRENQQAIEQINDQLIERNAFPLPKTMIALASYDFAQRDLNRLRQYGLTLEAMGDTKEAYAERVKANAEKFLRIDLIQEAISKQEDIAVSEEDINQELQKVADEAGRKPLAIRAQLEAQNRWDGFQENLRMKKTSDLLLERAKIKRVQKEEGKEGEKKPVKKATKKAE
ncbi:trigger factor [Candidatus Sumerlaeota bacterium]|nr:trigger factor [Candidatus Sumerlaeota bacterium]